MRKVGIQCPNRCNRETGGGVCGPCRLAMKEGYFLSPAPQQGEGGLPGRAERLARYAKRAAECRAVFDEEG